MEKNNQVQSEITPNFIQSSELNLVLLSVRSNLSVIPRQERPFISKIRQQQSDKALSKQINKCFLFQPLLLSNHLINNQSKMMLIKYTQIYSINLYCHKIINLAFLKIDFFTYAHHQFKIHLYAESRLIGLIIFPIFRMKPTSDSFLTTKTNQPPSVVNPFAPKPTESNPSNFGPSQPQNKNPFMGSPIIRSDQKKQQQPDPRPQITQPSQPEKPIMSRNAIKRVTQMKELARKKKSMHPHAKPKDLSLIHEESGESFISSQSGLVSDSSLKESNSESEGSQYWRVDNDEDQEYENESQCEDNLDRTVVMTRNKVTRPTLPAQKVSQPAQKASQEIRSKLLEHEMRLRVIMQQYSFQQITELYKQGKIKEIDYKRMLQMKSEKTQDLKEIKFVQNLENVQKNAIQIFTKFHNLHEKLLNDISGSQLKYKQLQKKYLSIQENTNKSSNPYNPEKIRLDLKLFQKQSEVQAKKQIHSKLTKCIEELLIKYNQHITSLNEQKKQNPNFSLTQVFKETSEFLKFSRRLYSNVLSSLMKNNQTGKSVVTQKAREILIKKLQHKHAAELQKLNLQNIFDIFKSKYGQSNDIEDISQEMFKELLVLSAQKTSQGFEISKNCIYEVISLVKMAVEKGELSEGKIYQDAVGLLKMQPISSLTLQEFGEKTTVQNFKFIHKKVHNKLLNQYQLIQSLHILFQTRKQAKIIKIQQERKQNISSHVDYFEKVVYSLNKVLNLCEAKNSNEQKRLSEYKNLKDYLKSKAEKLQRLTQRTDQLLRQSQNKITFKPLIPKKEVFNFDFRVNKEQGQKQTLTKESQKMSWTELISKKRDKVGFMISDNAYKANNFVRKEQNSHRDKYDCFDIEESQRIFAKEMLEARKVNSEKLKDQQTKKHFNKVYQLIQKNQIYTGKPEENIEDEPYRPQHESIFQELLDSVQLTGSKPSFNMYYGSGNLYPMQSHDLHISSPKKLPNSQKQNSYKWLDRDQSVEQIEAACQLFAREYYRNASIRDGIKLDDHQFYFLMSPEYRKYFMDKKVKDKELTDKILEIVRVSTKPNAPQSQEKAIKYMIESEGYFRERIEEYQKKVISKEKITDPNEPRLVYETEQDSTCDSQEFELLDRRIRQLQEKSMSEYYLRKYEKLRERESDHYYENEGDDNDVRVVYC